jgi:hypothetical protein
MDYIFQHGEVKFSKAIAIPNCDSEFYSLCTWWLYGSVCDSFRVSGIGIDDDNDNDNDYDGEREMDDIFQHGEVKFSKAIAIPNCDSEIYSLCAWLLCGSV